MCRIHLVLVLGSTKGLATTAIIPESIKKEKKNQKKKKKKKIRRGGWQSPGSRCHSGEIPSVSQYDGEMLSEREAPRLSEEEEEEKGGGGGGDLNIKLTVTKN
jgi:hypothetical protein